ncbi:uncharacterized protein isoform X2 [Musca autumnalis]|uniref:uncharacterized protein isoform X2 n=1 Tax=Musca autumnalis TaxID=221902 RepID=UPI003CF6BFD9
MCNIFKLNNDQTQKPLTIMSDEHEFGICPFNSGHRIVMYRMPAHVLKCRKNYRGPPMEICEYNATHFVPLGTMKEHLQECRAFHRFNEDTYIKMAQKSIRRDE